MGKGNTEIEGEWKRKTRRDPEPFRSRAINPAVNNLMNLSKEKKTKNVLILLLYLQSILLTRVLNLEHVNNGSFLYV